MANFCAVCRKYFITNNFLFPIPGKNTEEHNTDERHALWLAAINRKDLGIEALNVCSKHFVKGKPAGPLEKEDIDWVPTVNLGRKRRCEIENFCENVSKVPKLTVVTCSDNSENYEDLRKEREDKFQMLIKAEMERDDYFAKLEEEFAKQSKKPEVKDDVSDDDDSTTSGNKYSQAINSYVDRLESLNRILERELDHLRQETALLYDVYNFRLLNCITRRSGFQ